MSRIGGFIRLMRPVNCAMMGFAVLIGAVLGSLKGASALWMNSVYGSITGFTLTAASMAINDYYDRQIDVVNEPNRPIPSGQVKPRESLTFAAALTLLGFLFACLTSLLCLIVSIIAWLIFTAYTTVGKRNGLPGNFLVSGCVAIPFIYGSVAITDAVSINVLLFASMAFFSNTGREITKGIVDVHGDRAQKVKTLAVRYGEKAAAVTAVIFYLCAVLLSPLPWLWGLVTFWFLPIVAFTDVGLILSSAMLLKDYSRANARRVKKAVLLWFLVGLLAFVAGAYR